MECLSVYNRVIKHSAEPGIDGGRIAVCGDSAGDALAAGVILAARDRGISLPCFRMLIYLAADRRTETVSMKKKKKKKKKKKIHRYPRMGRRTDP